MPTRKVALWIKKNASILTTFSVFSLSAYALLASLRNGVIDSRLFFNSDALYLPTLYKDIFDDKFKYSGWMTPEATYFFPDGVIYFLTRLLLNNFVIATFLYSVFIFLLLFISFSFLYKALFPKTNYRSLLCINLLTGILILLTSHGKIFLLTAFLITPNMHQGTYLMMVVTAILSIRIIKKANQVRKRDYVFLFSTVTLTVISDRTFLFHSILPSLVTTTLYFLLTLNFRAFLRPLLKYSLTVTFALVVGLLVYQNIVPLPSPIEPIRNNQSLNFLIRDLKEILTADELKMNVATVDYHFHNDAKYLVMGSIIFLLIAAYLIINFFTRRRKGHPLYDHHRGLVYLSLFVSCLTISDVASLIISGRYTTLVHLRYITPTLLLPPIALMMLFSYLLFEDLPKRWQKERKSAVFYLQGMTLILLTGLFFLLTVKIPKTGLKTLTDYYPNFIRCLDENSEKYNLKYGIADYWESNLNTMLSKKNLRIYQVSTIDNYVDVFHVINNADWYIGDENTNYKNPEYNFVILKNLKREAVIRTLGQPENSFSCEDSEIFVYNWEKGNNLPRNRFLARFAFRKLISPGDSLNFPANTFGSSVIFATSSKQAALSQNAEGYLTATKEVVSPGTLTEGPALLLKEGRYEITLSYETGPLDPNESAGDLTIQTSSNPVAATAPLRGTATGGNFIGGQLNLGNEVVPGVPYRAKIVLFKVSFSGKADLTLKNLSIKKLD